jgi:hypothetical protein
VLPSLLGLPLRLVDVLAPLLVLEAAGDAFDSIQLPLRASVLCMTHPVIVTRCAAFVERFACAEPRSVPVVCGEESLDPLRVDGVLV